MIHKPNKKAKGVSVYANLTARRRTKADARARARAEYLATLPKHPVKRILYQLHPKRVFKFWFSKQGALMALKLLGVGVVIMVIFVAALFAFYRRELDAFRPSELAKRVTTTVSKYTDRNGVVLWEDKGDEEYRMVVESGDIAKVMKDATVAIEDRDFYNHAGISVTGLLRAGVNNATWSNCLTQGASTLTQQLIKQVFFEKDAAENRLSISRKIKEIILAIEVERMYNKEQILTLYLNEVPYGGRRNGVESAALTYFGKHAKDLNLPEAALLASIPQNPSRYNPYVAETEKTLLDALITRQHKVLDDMASLKSITKEQAEEAKKYPIMDTIKDEIDGLKDIKAPHFVLAVRQQLEEEFGTKVIREGGLTIKTTLDYRIQEVAENSLKKNYATALSVNANNMAMTSVDVPTGQVLAMVGSHDFYDKSMGGEVNVAVRGLEPGSSIKPFVYANLFKPQQGQNYGAGSILADQNIDKIYGGKLNNFDGKFYGALPIREGLALSRNPPAVTAAYIGGIDNAIQTARDAGDTDYCKGIDYGLSAAIGTCPVKLSEHTNAYATFARGGIYKKEAFVLEVKNSQGQTLKQWKDESKKVLDPQIAYIISDILSDSNARKRVFGTSIGNVPGVKIAVKTGTTDRDEKPQYAWMMSYTQRMATGVWMGRNDAKPIKTLSSVANNAVTTDVTRFAHNEIFAKESGWKPSDWFSRPSGIQEVTVNGRKDIYPSWYVKPTNADGEKIAFDRVSRKKATSCTPERAKVELTVQTFDDPVTKKKSSMAPDGYDATADDDVHKCEDAKPFVSLSTQQLSPTSYRITANVSQGTFALSQVDIAVDGTVISSQPVSSAGAYSVDYTASGSGSKSISATVIDQGYYDATATKSLSIASNGNSNNTNTVGAVGPPWGRRRGQFDF